MSYLYKLLSIGTWDWEDLDIATDQWAGDWRQV